MNSFIYVAALLALSGLGIYFLNSESLLALCFFIFVGLILRYSEPFAFVFVLQKTFSGEKQYKMSCLTLT